MTRLKTWFKKRWDWLKKRWDWLKKNWDYTIAPIVVVVAVVVNNWNRGWFNDLEGIDIVLIVAILLFFMGYLYILLRIIPTLEFVGGRVGKRNIQVFGTLLGSLVVFYLLWNLHGILPNKWVEISLLAGLVAVTSGLAVYAAAQAYASVKMAEATEKSITEAVRPMVLPSVAFGHSQDMESGQYYSDTMYATFKNIGRGPALHVEANIRHPYFEFEGPLPKTVLEVGEPIQLNISRGEQRPEESFELIAKYQNIHGKWFHSKLTQDEHGQYHVEYKELESKPK